MCVSVLVKWIPNAHSISYSDVLNKPIYVPRILSRNDVFVCREYLDMQNNTTI